MNYAQEYNLIENKCLDRRKKLVYSMHQTIIVKERRDR